MAVFQICVRTTILHIHILMIIICTIISDELHTFFETMNECKKDAQTINRCMVLSISILCKKALFVSL